MGVMALMGESIFLLGERGFHLLFDAATISAAFDEDPGALRAAVVAHRDELETVLAEIVCLDDAFASRGLIAALPPELRHVLVHLYFEILEARVQRRGGVLH
jgi:hypothetical protein